MKNGYQCCYMNIMVKCGRKAVNRMTKDKIIKILNLALEQEKAEACNDCAFADTEEWEEPCLRCKRNCKDYWRAGEK